VCDACPAIRIIIPGEQGLLTTQERTFTEAFTPLEAGLIMEETLLGPVKKSKITNCATDCNTVPSIRSFLRGIMAGGAGQTIGRCFHPFDS
jgi:hypothetical protein